MRSWQGICLSAVALVSFANACLAQSVTPEDEYKKLITVDQDIQPLGAHPFGENISLYDGTLSFNVADISVPGNGPTIQLGRVLMSGQGPGYALNALRPFGDWDLDIPRIETVVASPTLSEAGALWKTVNSPTQRCTYFNVPPDYGPTQPGADPWAPNQWWYGYHLMMPGEGSQTLLLLGTPTTINGMSYSINTKQHWMIGCGVTASDGGEGFQAIAPDGTRYTFAHLVYHPTPDITSPLGTAPAAMTGKFQPMVAPFNILFRRDAFMYVTQIQDRFGNTLTYNYSGDNLTSIVASDGRQVSLTYVSGTPLVHTVTVQATNATPRTWTYSYDTTTNSALPTLTGVQLPDGSAWSYSLFDFQIASIMTEGGDCSRKGLPTLSSTPVTGSITHPSGLTATFTLTPMLHGRSYVTQSCYGAASLGSDTPFSTFPEYAYQFSLTSEVLSGAGMPTETWSYSYSPANESWSNDPCATSGTCVTTVYTDVTDPDGNDTRSTFSNRFDATDGQLLRTDYYSGSTSGTLMRSVANTYANPTGGPWPASYGFDLQDRDNRAQTVTVSPLQQRVITQDGDTYTWQAEAFDVYAHVTKTKRFSSTFSQCTTTSTQCIEEQTSYLNDTNLWVLGLPLQVTNVATGEVESANTYATNDTLLTRARFGQPLMSYTFNSAGQLASFTDGNSHTTSLSDYKRGIPQTISYPDSTSENLVVDDLGQISSITDQAGHTTSYSYDPVGRITGISYPSGDEVAWTPETFSYSFVASAERGLAANHWKRTTTTGNAVAVTYFDAMLRPVLSDSDIGSTVQASTLSTYDSKGQKLFSAYPSATALTFTQSPTVAGSTTTYDALGRTTQVQQTSELGTLTSSTAYLSGAREQVTDPKSNVTTTSYQVFDEPSYDAVTQVQAPTGITQTIARDIYGNPLSITQSGPGTNPVIKSLVYDSYHRLCRTTEPESGSEVMSYDAANNLAWSASGLAITGSGCGQEQVAAAAQTTRTYDAMNRVKTILPPAGTQSTSYGYDPVGRLTSAVSGTSTWNGTYNFRGMLTGESEQLAGQNPWAIGYAHDANGHTSLIHYPDGENVSYAPDALGRPTQVGSYASSIGYFPNGQVSGFVYGNGTGYVAEQNTRQLLSNFSYGPGSTVQLSEDLVYDKNANISTVTDLAGGPRSKSFGYDALNRLTSATAAGLWGTQAYTYDALNNLRTLQTGSQVATYTYDATNKLTGISGALSASYTYDPRGNVATKNGTSLAFDQKNQLTQIGSTDAYTYDAAGRRVSKNVGGVTTYYFYNQAGQLMYQWAPGSALSTSFVYLGSKLVGDNETVVLGAPATIGFNANPSNGSVTVSWGAVAGATSYLLQESANGGAWATVYSGSAASAALSGKAGGSYVYRAEGCIGTTCGAFTSSATLGVTPALPTMTVPSGTINGTYTVSWTAPASATSYDVQERLGTGSWTTIASNTAATSISRPGTTSGSYTYQVSAKNTYGTRGWAVSAAVTVDTTYGVVPAAPATLTVPATSSNGSATLSWGAATLATTYVVQQSSNGSSSWSGIYSSSGTSTAVSGLADGSYVYQVQACNTYGCSAWKAGSATLVVTHPPTAAPILTAPATSANGSYTVSWTAVATATSYTLQEQVNAGAWTTIQTANALSKAIAGKGNGSYGYQVQACNAGGCGAWSTAKTTTVLLPPAAPASITVPATSSGSVAVSWAASATATSYTLQHRLGSGGWSTAYSGAATSSTVSETASGSYTYQVEACNTGGCSAFKASSAVTVTIPPATAPSLTVPATSYTGSYTVSWSAVTEATSYTLQEQVNAGAWATIQSSSATSKALSGKGAGSYGYRVQACNAGGCGPWSGTGTIVVTLVPATPASITAPTSEPYPAGSWTVSWAAVSGATSYTLQRTNTATSAVATVYTGSATSTLDGNSLLLVPDSYVYAVKACNAAGCSGWRNSAALVIFCPNSPALQTQGVVQPDLVKCGGTR